MTEQTDTVVVGGGQAGLAMSYYLTQQGREHIVLERSHCVGESWRRRWDSFDLVTPNWQLQLPGMPYQGSDPDGFLLRDEVVAYLEQYAALFCPPLRFGAQVTSLEQDSEGPGYLVKTPDTVLKAANVVVATGMYQHPKIPSLSRYLSAEISQIHTSEYRNPQALLPGAVLVVGSGQSGTQIAKELYESGRRVYLSVGSAGRLPRRYRGKDITWWASKIGMYDQTVDKLPSPKAKFAGSRHVANLHQFARDGIVLLGHLQGAEGSKVLVAPDLKESLAKEDGMEADLIKTIDRYVQETGLNVPKESLPELRDGYDAEVIRELDLESVGITSIIWATGYKMDFSWVKLPVFDGDGYPIQVRGVTEYPGLYFLGLVWLHTIKSSLLYGVGEDAAHIAASIAVRAQDTRNTDVQKEMVLPTA